MTESWFAPDVARYFSLFSLLAVTAVLTVFARRGQYRSAVMAAGAALVAFGALFLIAGVVAWLLGQPRFVHGPLLLVGFVTTVVWSAGVKELRQLYAAAELRKMTAQDI
jgi:CHASE2 domain-containing sensor protein